jgi:hypothetical protein
MRARVAAAAALLVVAVPALSGPVLVYREGAYCPRDRDAAAPRLGEAEIVSRALALLPGDFCGPSRFVSGCEAEPEQAYDSWRVYIRQYRLAAGEKRFDGLDHTYVVLDAVGNCLANIPGT